MATIGTPYAGNLFVGRKTQTAGTIISCLVVPQAAEAVVPGADTGVKCCYIAHITSAVYTTGATAHTVTFLRPLNYTTFTADAAINQAVVNIAYDPGIYSGANYRYTLGNGAKSASVADNAIAASDWVAYQLVDGSWILDTVASVATLAITLTTNIPNITGGGVKSGGLLYWFGVAADTNPQDGQPHPGTITLATTSKEQLLKDQLTGGVQAYNFGDPLIVQSNNAAAAGSFEGIEGFYAKV